MVVRICVIPVPLIHPQFDFKAHLFSSEKGEWKSVVISSPRAIRFRVRYSATLVPYKGMLHWLISGVVLVYDPYNCPETFCRVIDTPADIDNMMAGVSEREQRFRTMGLFQDRLRVTHVWRSVYYIWELEDYNMGKWSLVHKISCRATAISGLWSLPNHPPNLDPKTRDTGFSYIDGNTFCWTNSSVWWIAKGMVHWIPHQCWPTPVPPLTACTIQNNENTFKNS
ncbi:uncharacterized protein LOC116019503 isoform X2 [Ipomoea triloba]|nr:uncharacterized protein LOC116019503 isoform X2 [Ipomoea triloba]